MKYLLLLCALCAAFFLGIYVEQTVITEQFVLLPRRELRTAVDSLLHERDLNRLISIACATDSLR